MPGLKNRNVALIGVNCLQVSASVCMQTFADSFTYSKCLQCLRRSIERRHCRHDEAKNDHSVARGGRRNQIPSRAPGFHFPIFARFSGARLLYGYISPVFKLICMKLNKHSQDERSCVLRRTQHFYKLEIQMPLFKKPDPKKIAEIVRKMERERDQALAEVENISQELGAAKLDSEVGLEGSAKTQQDARKALEKAKATLEELNHGLAAANARYSAELKAEHEITMKLRWKETEELAHSFINLGKEIEVNQSAVVEKLNQLIALGQKIHESAPIINNSFNHSSLTPNQLSNDFRLLLRKLGCQWAHKNYANEFAVPEYSELISKAVGLIMKEKPAAGPQELLR